MESPSSVASSASFSSKRLSIPALVAYLALMATGTSALARDYSLHMLVHVSSRCSLHRTAAFITPIYHHTEIDDHAEPGGEGAGGVHIACNVPYSMVFRRVDGGAKVKLAPLAAVPDDPLDRFDVSVALRARDGDVQARCGAADLTGFASGCAPLSRDLSPLPTHAATMARIVLLAPADRAFDFPLAAGNSEPPERDGASDATQHAQLQVVLSGRF